MSGGTVCRCPESRKPLGERNWTVLDYKCNHSAFNGYRYTPSDWSKVRCNVCPAMWQTKAAYVDQLVMANIG